jgi:hypothetical protein
MEQAFSSKAACPSFLIKAGDYLQMAQPGRMRLTVRGTITKVEVLRNGWKVYLAPANEEGEGEIPGRIDSPKTATWQKNVSIAPS